MKYIAFLLLAPFSLLGQPDSAPTGTEEPPALSAKEILKPEFLAGDGFTVQDEVPTSTGRNRYLIVSEYGEFEGDGNIMLERRVKEVAAIRKLKEVSRTDEYKKALKAAVASPLMGCDRAVADRFINSTAFSPSVQTVIVMNLETLKGVGNRAAFIDLAGSEASDEGDALFFLGTSRVLAELHAKKPLARLQQVGRLPVAVQKDGRAIVAVQWDYAAWTDNVANFAGLLKASDFGKKPSSLTIAISGDASPLAQQKLQEENVELVARTAPGPLR